MNRTVLCLILLPALAAGIDKFTISRDESVYKAFADIAQTKDGVLVVTYRESMMHGAYPFSRLKVRRSLDGGYRWLPEQTLLEKDATQRQGSLNCPRIAAMSDGSLLLVIDYMPPDRTREEKASILLFRSTDAGATWSGPADTGIRDAIVPSLKQLSNGDLLLGLTRLTYPDGTLANHREEQQVYRSSDLGKSWQGPSAVPQHPQIPLNLNEGDFAEMDDGTVVLYMREDKEGLSGWKSLSKDSGRTWSEPMRAHMHSVCGRPSAGRLRSGEVVVTYRTCNAVSASLALYVESAAEAVRTKPRNRDQYATDYHAGRWMLLDNDRSLYPDTGYSGWVQLPDGRLLVVNYLIDDAPRAFIRGYRVAREDYLLFPEGEIPWMHPSRQPYVEMAREKSRQQAEKNRLQGARRVPSQK